MKLIDISTPMFPNTFTMVDDADYEWLSKYNWSAWRNRNGMLYATRRLKQGGKWKHRKMHKDILGVGDGGCVDHANTNSLDNQRRNLRPCTNAQNQHNARLSRTNTSGFKGVHWHKSEYRWRTRIYIEKKQRQIISHICVFRAAYAYDSMAVKTRGEFARINGVRCNCQPIISGYATVPIPPLPEAD